MGRIVAIDNVSLDGVVQDPAGDEGFSRGGWVGLIKDRPQLNKLALDEALGSEAMLVGHRTYKWFDARWPSHADLDVEQELTMVNSEVGRGPGI